jgi:PAS domain S-box-containing protein
MLSDSITIGILLFLAGLVFFLLVLGVPRLMRWGRSRKLIARTPVPGENLNSHDHAVFVVQPGGRVDYINPAGREWFALRDGEHPNLESLARRIRPHEEFLKLCLTEGKARFSVNGRPMEAVSYQIPGVGRAMMVTLSRLEIASVVRGGENQATGSIVQILTDFNQALSASSGLLTTIQASLENVERLVPADILEINLWDSDSRYLIPYRFGTGSGAERQLERSFGRPVVGYSAKILSSRKALFIPDTEKYGEIFLDAKSEQMSVRSYIGLPLLTGSEMVGTLELGAVNADAYAPEDLEVLDLISGQVAIALHNASMLEVEKRRAGELGGLASLAQVAVTPRDPQEIVGRLIQNISPLFNVEILGFLLYNENTRSLEAQVPFKGMPAQVVNLYHVPLATGSSVEERFLKQELLVTNNAMDDEFWQDMGFQDYARAASWRDTVLVPLVSSGRPLGYLQASNHSNSEQGFSSDERQLLQIVANQVGPILDNITLLRQVRDRAQRSEALRRITSLASSSATLEEILRYSIQELARLLGADMACVFLYDESRGMLQLHRESRFGQSFQSDEVLSRLFIDENQFHFTVTGSRKALLSGHLPEDPQILSIYRPLVESLEMESALVVPLAVSDRGLGELILASRAAEAFSQHDMQIVTTAAGQIASAIERDALRNQTDPSLRGQVDQLTALTRVSRELNANQEWKYLLQIVYDESLRATQADCGTVLLLDPAAPGDDGEIRVAMQVGDQIGSVLDGELKQVCESREAVLIPVLPADEPPKFHDGVQSALFVPILHQDHRLGLIALHSSSPDGFDQSCLELLQTLALQAGISFKNARRFQEQTALNEQLARRERMLSRLFDATASLESGQGYEQSMEILAQGLQEATPFQVILISTVEPGTLIQRRVAGAGIPADTLARMKAHQQPWNSVAQLLRPEFKFGTGYFIPHNKRPVVTSDVQLVTLMEGQTSDAKNAWHPEDAFFFPLVDQEGSPVGLISLDSPRDGLRPDASILDEMEIFVAQATTLILNNLRLTTYRSQVEQLATSLDRQQQLVSISQGHLPVLLHKDLEQMISIRTLERRARRIRAGLEITETINRQVDAPSALQALGRELLTRLEMSVSIVAENTPDGPRLLHVLGNVPRGVNPEALFGQRNPLRYTLQMGEPLLAMNLEQDEPWRDAPLLTSLHAKGFICLPILVDGKPIAGVLAISLEALPELTDEDRQTYLQISRQVSIILQNLTLLTETRRRLREVNLLLDFSRQLSGLDPDRIVRALLDSALRVVTLAHAGVALLYQPEMDLLIPKAAAGYPDVDSLMRIVYHSGEALPGRVFREKRPRRVEEINFTRDYDLPAEQLMHYREAMAGRLPNSSLVVPIQTGDRALGVLVLDNFNTASAFTADDQALLLSLTQQVALSLENVRLVHASQERTAQLQALTTVSATMTASLLSSDLVSGLLGRLQEVLSYDTAILWLREGDHMSVAAASGFPDNEQRLGLTVNISDSALLAEMNRTSQGIVVGDVRTDPRFPSLVQAERLSWMGVPLVSKGEVTGVIALEKTEANYFSLEVTQLIATFASQAAVALENARLYEDSLRRAAELDERSQRLSLLNRLSSDLSGSLNEDQVLSLTAEELQRALGAKRISMVAFDRFGTPILRAAVPAKEKFQPAGLPAAPIFTRLRESLGVFSTEAVQKEADLEPLGKLLKGTHSLLILPLVSAQKLRALAFVHMDKAYHFSATDIDLTRTISNQAAVALESARLYQATVSRAEQLTIINRASYEIGLSLDPEQIYAATHRAAAELMAAESFVISLVDEQQGDIEGVYLMDPSGRAPNQHLPREAGISGRVISTGEPLLIPDVEEVEKLGGRTFGEGQPRSIVAVPITIGGKVTGMLSAQSYQANAYTEEDQQILSTLANQAGVAIQNGRLFDETRRLAEELEQRVIERTAELAREQRNTETLLRILTEASSTLDLDRALNRTLALLNDAIGAEQGSILMVNPEDNTIHYRAGYGYLTPVMTEGSRPTPLKIGEGLAGWVIANREPVRLDDVRQDERWMSISSSTTQHRSAIAAPLMVGEDAIGVIMVFHRQEAYFTPEHTNLVKAIGNQVAVAINNAQLYNLIRDQAERLGSMLRNQQIEASRQQAILEAVADGVVVTDPGNEITFLNRSAERILDLDSAQITGQPLESFVGLFGKAAQTWMQTIHTWSQDPGSHQATDTYAEQLTLETGRVVLVHLAPVIWRREFLGTVSIFRDITHEVEIDRLKSEFVATVSHELRTPMTSIKGYVDILLMGAAGALNENQMHFLDIVRSNTDRLSVLVNDLLDISRIEAGRVSLTLQPINLREVADDVVLDIVRRSEEENKAMEFTMDIPPDLPLISGDLERVRQIIDNLVDNAYHYTPENGKVNIKMQAVDGMVEVDVTDSGIGIDPVEAERVFDRFYRGENPLVLATPGTGLGLAIVKQLVIMHKGEIWMKSQGIPGEGSVFSFTLPIHQAEE